MTPLNYYQKTLGLDLIHAEPFLQWLQQRCDSQLEIMFGLSLIEQYHTASKDTPPDMVWDRGASLYLCDPFGASPSFNGASVAHLMCQYPYAGGIWDFSIHTSTDNGHELDQSKLSYLLEIDGFGIHRHRRKWDEVKSLRAGVKVLRFQEENFLNVNQMALAALWASIWHCDCDQTDNCNYCKNLVSRVTRFP